MEYKIFGPGRTPSGEIRNQLKEFFKLDEAQRKTIREVFLKEEWDYSRATLPDALAASSLLPEQFTDAIELIRSLLFAWREYDLQVGDIERDLLLLGCSEQDVDLLIHFLGTLSDVKDTVWADSYRRTQHLDGLPTVDSLNIICDARAVFGGFPEGTERARPSYKTLLALTPIVIMEIISSDYYGQQQRTAVQMSERDFESFQRIVSRAQEQLAILKMRIEKPPLGS